MADDADRTERAVLRPRGRGRGGLPGPDQVRHLQLRRRGRTGGAEGRRARRGAARRGRYRVAGRRGRARSHERDRPMGRDPSWRRRPAAARPPGRRARGGRGLAGAPLLGRDPRRLRLGPRGDRHEGLQRDGALGRPGADPRGSGARAADHVVLHRRRGSRRTPRRPAPGRGPRRRAGALHRGGGRGRRLQHQRPRTPPLPRRGGGEGDGVGQADGPRPRRARVADQPRQRHHRPDRGRRQDRRPRVAGPPDADDADPARGRGRAGRHRGHAREHRGAGGGVRRARPR